MKRIFLLASVVTLLVASVYATQVDSMRAINVAKQFMPSKPVHKKNAKGQTAAPQASQIVYTHYMPKSGKPAIYVVNIGSGFALVSADDVAHPILGYNYGKAWPTDGQALPPSVKGFLDDLAAQMEAASEHPQDAETAAEWQEPRKALRRSPKRTPSSLPDSVGPLLTTTWDQGQYYNSLCPADSQSQYDGHVLTGCVATAMAQIIKYWGDRQTIYTRGIHSYESTYGTLTVNYDTTTYDFANMPAELTSQSTPTQVNTVATLMRDCGVAANMQYNVSESGTTGVNARVALVNNFSFNSSTTYFCKRGYKHTDWEQILCDQLVSERPIIYNSIDTTMSVGHSFVCDGYKQDGYFHFNFGWSGNGDGWYQLSSVNPGLYTFDSNQSAIVNIAPEDDESIIYDHMYGKSYYMIDTPTTIYNSLSNSSYRGIIDDWYYGSDTLVFYPDSIGAEIEFTLNSLQAQSGWITYIRVYDGTTADTLLREFSTNDKNGFRKNDMSPVVSTKGALCVYINGPVFYDGYCFEVYKHNGCIRVTDINVKTDTTAAVITWTNHGGAIAWQVEYGESGFKQGTGTIISVSDTFATIYNLTALAQYDVYVRPSCENGKYGRWSRKISFRAGGKLWKNQVSSQPIGYEVDEHNNVIISSKEGLAWLANDVKWNNRFKERQVHLICDVDMSGYEWTPIRWFEGSFYGHGHTISNLCMKDGGMFTDSWPSIFDDIHLRNIYVEEGSGGLIDSNNRSMIITNCSATGTIKSSSSSNVGGIIGYLENGVISNCWSSCFVDASGAYSAGGICGRANKSQLKNCCFYGKVIMNYANDIGGVIGYSEYTNVERCYALYDTFDGKGDLACGGLGTTTKDIEWFTREDTVWTLMNSIAFENETTKNLLDALNNEVIELNDSSMRTWEIDSTTTLPRLGYFYEVICPNITDLSAYSILNDKDEVGVVLTWTENGDANCWEIQYQQNTTIGHAITTDIPDTIWGLASNCHCIFSVRSLCDSSHHSGWGEKLNHMVDRPYWVDMVTSKPEGFEVAPNGDVTISSAEGLAWLVREVNGLNGDSADNFYGKKVTINQDIELKQYKWTPINHFNGTFDGGNHVVKNLYVNELTDYCGFFGMVMAGVYRNILLDSVNVSGKECIGGLFGYVTHVPIINCHVSGNIYGEISVGGIAGRGSGIQVDKCSFVGDVQAKHHYAGGLFGEIARTSTDSSVRNCYSRCNVNVNGFGAGGLIGPCYDGVIENCYSTGIVRGLAYDGGLLASFGDNNYSLFASICNCYTNVKLDESTINGVIIGVTTGYSSISHCYGPSHNSSIHLIGPVYLDGEQTPIISDTASFTKIDSNITLDTSVNIGEANYTDLLSALNAWVNANNSEGQYCHWVADMENINGGFPIFDPTESPTTDIESAQPSNINVQKILYNGQIFILRGNKIYNIDGQLVR